jgi:DNA polymerase III subunit delta'
LLKLFEEPPSNVYVILVSERSDMLLPTVLSRAQVFRMEGIQLEAASERLANRNQLNKDLVFASLISSDRNIQEAIVQIEQQNIPSIEMLRKLLQNTYTYNVSGILEWLDSFLELNKEEQKKFLHWIQLLLSSNDGIFSEIIQIIKCNSD